MSYRFCACVAVAVTIILSSGCALTKQKQVVQRTKIEQCPSAPVTPQCVVAPLPSSGNFLRMLDGMRVRDALKNVGVILGEHKDCQDEVRLWRLAYERCNKGR